MIPNYHLQLVDQLALYLLSYNLCILGRQFQPFTTHFKCRPLSDMPISSSSNSTSNNDMMSKIWTNGDTVI